MRILYLDTSSSFLYCGVVDDDKLIDKIALELKQDLSTETLYNIQLMFNKNNINVHSIDKIMVVNGPGSFTGVRIGLTIAKTYAWALNIPISVISSLEAMAISSSASCDFLVPLLDARRGYVYSAIFDSKTYNQVLKEQYISLEALKVAIKSLGESHTLISNDKFPFDTESYSPDILKIVTNLKDRETINPHSVDANYLKLTEAEEKLNAN